VLLGLILLFFPTGESTYRTGEVTLRSSTGPPRLGGLLLLLVLLLELADRVVMERDWKLPKTFRHGCCRARRCRFRDIRLLRYAAGQHGGGDYYDVILRPGQVSGGVPSESPNQDRILFVVADVAGKSIPAAMVMAPSRPASEPCRPAASRCRRWWPA